MAEPRTRPTDASVPAFIDAVEPAQKREDCRTLVAMMERLTGAKATMWGPSIVGFDSYTDRNAAKPLDWPITGFSPRKANLTIYITPGFERHGALLERLGRHTTGKSCLYIKQLADVDLGVLEELIAESVALMRKIHPAE